MKFSRRNFLQTIGISLTSWGVLGDNIFFNGDAYGANLPNSRKLALLVGINQYSEGKNLKGCVTDTELQKQLLIHRFGFLPSDIITLLDRNATRENILETFQQHLIQQAQNNDIVIFHFSGYGRRVKLNRDESSWQNSLITYDSIKAKDNFVDDILLDTIIKLSQSLKTNKYTFILDTSFVSFPEFLTNEFSLRCYPSSHDFVISPQELELNQQLLKNNSKITLLKNNNPSSGFILSPSLDSIAIEINSLNFHVGLFTYALTQSLWQNNPQTDNLTLMKKVAFEVALASGNGEKVFFPSNSQNEKYIYNLSLEKTNKGDAIITNFSDPNLVEFDLVGLPLLVLYNYGLNSYFTGIVNDEKVIVIQLNYLQGNKAKGILINSPKNLISKGLILQESVRIIDRNTGLNVGLNNSLEKIERVDATSALSAVNNIESVINLGDNFADCIFGKFINNNNSIEGYGLFSSAGILFPNTAPKIANEAVSSAVKRLTPAFKIALAEKLLNLTLNQSSSSLSLNINLKINHNNQTYIHSQQTTQSQHQKILTSSLQSPKNQDNLLISIPFGSQLTITIDNENDHNLYYILFGINSSRQGVIYFPSNAQMIQGKNTISFPENTGNLKWLFDAEKALGKLILICSKSPFNQTLSQLNKISEITPENEQIISLENPVVIAKAILEDLHLGSNITSNLVNNLSDVYALDLNHWATFNFLYEIIDI
ncbi:caspase family protein [Geminocystis herdmanii]|uniref:caspase family protein n=1 Tax=Geminocystis herdmanii TaxID=669359 RepID=UPI000345490E|nr:caspase family protein [Geminocystis herdmanii]